MGVDPKTIPHQLWHDWERDLNREFLKLAKVKNLIDEISGSSLVSPRDYAIRTHNSSFAGVSWQNKTEILREALRKQRCDAMVRAKELLEDFLTFNLGCNIADRDRLPSQPQRLRLSLRSSLQSLHDSNASRNHSLHKSI